ncbi:MAG: hypothetical protein JOZ48_18145 [Acidobacteriaceae bacterium]|nr:hypothetical protein [Acidobacteriaceae bacterium]
MHARRTAHMNCAIPGVLGLSFFLITQSAQAQQSYIGRFDAYGGFMYLDSPHISLGEPGFHMQVGVRPRSWFSLGFDYSVGTGDTTLKPSLFTTTLQQQLGAELTQLAALGEIPAGYTLSLPIHSQTQTFAGGPQLGYHHWSRVTLYLRPSIGYIHEIATPHPADPIAAAIVAQLAPSGKKKDWTPFYGVGGGAEVNVSTHFAVRMQLDVVHDHLFSDLLKDGRTSVRFSIGPAVQFGGNVVK